METTSQDPAHEAERSHRGITDAQLEERFFYHAPSGPGVVRAHAAVSALTCQCAKDLAAFLPPNQRGTSLAMTKLEEARMWANQAIAMAQVELASPGEVADPAPQC